MRSRQLATIALALAATFAGCAVRELPHEPRHLCVAAANSSAGDRNRADLVCSGEHDEVVIADAIERLTRGGTVQLLDGDYYIDGFPCEGNAAICAGYNGGRARVVNLVGTTENKSYNTAFGAVIHVTKRALESINPAKGDFRVFYGTARKPDAKPDWFTYTHVNNMNFENFYLKFADATKPLIGIDCRNFGSSYMKLVGVYTEQYFRDRFEHQKPATPAKGLTGIVTTGHSNDEMARIGFDWVNVGGLHTGFRFVGADHVVMRSCSAARCCRGYDFSSMAKTLTLVNCCDEGNAHLPVFRGKGQISMIDFNIERFNAAFIPDDPDGDAEPYATEEIPGAWSGSVSYTLQGRAFGLKGFWKDGHGGGFRAECLNAKAPAARPVRSTAGVGSGYRAINITSGRPDRIDFIASEINRQHRTVGLDTFAPSMQFHVRPELDAIVATNLATWRAIRAKVDKDVRLGILVQSSLGGHSGQDGPPEDWQRSEYLTGKVSQRTCVLEPKFHAYMKRTFRAIAEAKPAFVLVDDDFSTRKHECCCPRHLELVSKALGRPVDKAELEKILCTRPLDDAEYVKATDAIYGAFEDLAREIRAAINEVDPTLRCGLCSGGCMLGGLKRTALALAGKTEPFVRFCNAVYGPQDPYTVIHSVAVAERMRAFVEPISDLLCEGDTYPHNAMSTPAARFNAALANNALSGIGGVKLWMSDFRHDSFRDSQHRYEAVYKAWEGFRLELLRLAREGIAWQGIAAVVFNPEIRLAPVKRDDGIDPWYEYPAMVLAPYGLPIRYARPGAGGIFAVSAGEAKMLSKAERETLVKGPLILDPKSGDLFPERGEKTYVSEVSPAGAFYVRYSTPARERFKAEVDRLAGGLLEMSLEVEQPAFVRHGVLKDGRELVAVTSLSEDPLDALPLRLRRTPKSVETLGKDGRWLPVAFARTADDVVAVRQPATLYAPVALRFAF